MKNSFAIIIAIGLAICGCFIGMGVRSAKMLDRSVSVRGLSEIERKADKAIWPIVFQEMGDNMYTLSSTTEQKSKIIVEFLTKNGIDEQNIQVNSSKIEDTRSMAYGTYPGYRYKFTQVVIVSTSNVDLVLSLMNRQNELLNQGIAVQQNWEFPTKFEFTDLDGVKPQMIEEATKNARITAEKFAQDSQSKLGKIKRASQGQVSITDRDEHTPQIKIIRVVTSVEYMLED